MTNKSLLPHTQNTVVQLRFPYVLHSTGFYRTSRYEIAICCLWTQSLHTFSGTTIDHTQHDSTTSRLLSEAKHVRAWLSSSSTTTTSYLGRGLSLTSAQVAD